MHLAWERGVFPLLQDFNFGAEEASGNVARGIEYGCTHVYGWMFGVGCGPR